MREYLKHIMPYAIWALCVICGSLFVGDAIYLLTIGFSSSIEAIDPLAIPVPVCLVLAVVQIA